ncbi:EAL domain-containing protein [Halomonas sp. ANAO-440]|uniref:EAL domain-containing protein n=1 Tax=Halomonas sp. ANAO-440 TaxID=2861360 RepID=UPI001CAA66B2|nr:EAL domain-containing protein [Halomonas sp. ANAO-440]MBZ0330578.1 EAL domain-containing protein [Halomonas sp. ANAO-440]
MTNHHGPPKGLKAATPGWKLDCQRGLMAFAGWWLAALLVSGLLPSMSDNLPISPLWVANSLAYGTVLAIGVKPVPYFTMAALTWNLARGDTHLEVLVGTAAFVLLMFFVVVFSSLLGRYVERDRARRLLRVPIIALMSATLFTFVGVWQFSNGRPAPELIIGLWLSEATSVLLFTPLARQWLRHGVQTWALPEVKSRQLPMMLAWSALAIAVLVLISAMENMPWVLSSWLPYLALVMPILAVYLLPVGLPRLVAPLFMLAWTLVNLNLYTDAAGVLDETAMLQGQMILFTAALVGFLSIEAVHSYHRANRRLQQASRQDGLTGLNNDLGMTESLAGRKVDEPHALIGIQVPDIDDLATLIGLDEVHALECCIAETLRETVPTGCVASARLQPGLFALLVPMNAAPATVAHDLRDALHSADQDGGLSVARLELRVVLVESIESHDARHLTSILLMASARAATRKGEHFYHHHGEPEQLIEAHRDALYLVGYLRDALAGETRSGSFEIFAQPILDLRQPEVIRAEMLLRWRHADGRLLGAGDFLPIAERFGLMPRLDAWVLSKVLSILSTHPGGERLDEVAINISGDTLAGADLVSLLSECLARYGWPSDRLCLEITESMVIHDVQVARENVRQLHTLGVCLAIDDFGTGHASFSYLQDFPVQKLKIDGRFTKGIVQRGIDREIVRSTCAIADYLGARVVAEFIETSDQMEVLSQLGVHCFQGYGICRPIPLEVYLEGLQQGRSMIGMEFAQAQQQCQSPGG